MPNDSSCHPVSLAPVSTSSVTLYVLQPLARVSCWAMTSCIGCFCSSFKLWPGLVDKASQLHCFCYAVACVGFCCRHAFCLQYLMFWLFIQVMAVAGGVGFTPVAPLLSMYLSHDPAQIKLLSNVKRYGSPCAFPSYEKSRPSVGAGVI